MIFLNFLGNMLNVWSNNDQPSFVVRNILMLLINSFFLRSDASTLVIIFLLLSLFDVLCSSFNPCTNQLVNNFDHKFKKRKLYELVPDHFHTIFHEN